MKGLKHSANELVFYTDNMIFGSKDRAKMIIRVWEVFRRENE